ncbi:hypothetical protein NQ318_005632, partial [Aromia moschata]
MNNVDNGNHDTTQPSTSKGNPKSQKNKAKLGVKDTENLRQENHREKKMIQANAASFTERFSYSQAQQMPGKNREGLVFICTTDLTFLLWILFTLVIVQINKARSVVQRDEYRNSAQPKGSNIGNVDIII